MAKIPASVLIVAVVLLLCLILAVIATIIPDWLQGEFRLGNVQTYTREIGLWRTCGRVTTAGIATDCLLIMDQIELICPTFETTFRWLQALSVIACVSFFLAMVLIPIARMLLRQPIMMMGTFFAFLGWVAALVVVILFKVDVQDDTSACSGFTALIPKPADLRVGWILMLIACVFGFIALTFSFWFCLRKSAGGQRPPTPGSYDDKNQSLMMNSYPTDGGYYGGGGGYPPYDQSYQQPYADHGYQDPSYQQYPDQGGYSPYPDPGYQQYPDGGGGGYYPEQAPYSTVSEPYPTQQYSPPPPASPPVTATHSYTPPPGAMTTYSPPRAYSYSPPPSQPYAATFPAGGRDPLFDRLSHVKGKLANTLEQDTRRSLSPPPGSYRRPY